jgi:hypothetical protein
MGKLILPEASKIKQMSPLFFSFLFLYPSKE